MNRNDRSDLVVQLVEAVAAKEDGASQVSDTEMDSAPEPQLLPHSRSPHLRLPVGVFVKRLHTADEKWDLLLLSLCRASKANCLERQSSIF